MINIEIRVSTLERRHYRNVDKAPTQPTAQRGRSRKHCHSHSRAHRPVTPCQSTETTPQFNNFPPLFPADFFFCSRLFFRNPGSAGSPRLLPSGCSQGLRCLLFLSLYPFTWTDFSPFVGRSSSCAGLPLPPRTFALLRGDDVVTIYETAVKVGRLFIQREKGLLVHCPRQFDRARRVSAVTLLVTEPLAQPGRSVPLSLSLSSAVKKSARRRILRYTDPNRRSARGFRLRDKLHRHRPPNAPPLFDTTRKRKRGRDIRILQVALPTRRFQLLLSALTQRAHSHAQLSHGSPIFFHSFLLPFLRERFLRKKIFSLFCKTLQGPGALDPTLA